uniref:Putative ovule protein n=1 Tax=Solanum chacoense TaxID=4108 RepID=A0A0V0GFS0_SOLCH
MPKSAPLQIVTQCEFNVGKGLNDIDIIFTEMNHVTEISNTGYIRNFQLLFLVQMLDTVSSVLREITCYEDFATTK